MRVRTNEAIDLEKTDGVDWKAIDTALRTIAQRRGGLDALEAKWIREALRVKIWREVGCVTMAEYLERRLGYAPRTAHDRVRVAIALEELPKLAAALEAGFPHSAVRELTRVCTNENEQKWLDKVRGKTVHEIEGLVSGRARGADPEDPPQPNLVGRTLPFEGVRPATEALVRDARRMLQELRGGGEILSDDEVLASFARIVLEGGGSLERKKAPYQIAISLCERCGAACQESGGRKFALSKADLERACCDAQWIGHVDTDFPERATQTVPPSARRLVHRRARGRCEVPGCRSTRCLEIHHIIPRALGGTHEVEGLILLCDGCHASHHRGLIAISGTASALVVTRKHEITYDQAANDEGDAAMDTAPSAHVGTNASQDCDEGDVRLPEASTKLVANGIEVSAHVGKKRDQDCGECLNSLAVPMKSDSQEPNAVGNGGSVLECGLTSSLDVPTKSGSKEIVTSAHVGTNESQVLIGRAGTRSMDPPTKLQANALRSSALVGTPAPEPTRFDRERIRSQARMALVTLGYRSRDAGEAVDLAIRYGHDSLESVIREALRVCTRSS